MSDRVGVGDCKVVVVSALKTAQMCACDENFQYTKRRRTLRVYGEWMREQRTNEWRRLYYMVPRECASVVVVVVVAVVWIAKWTQLAIPFVDSTCIIISILYRPYIRFVWHVDRIWDIERCEGCFVRRVLCTLPPMRVCDLVWMLYFISEKILSTSHTCMYQLEFEYSAAFGRVDGGSPYQHTHTHTNKWQLAQQQQNRVKF